MRIPLIFFWVIVSPCLALGQCPSASFNMPATACVQQSLLVDNSSAAAVNYEWDFCDGSILNTPQVLSSNTIGGLGSPFDVAVQVEGSNYYVFIASKDNNSIFRLDYGASLANIPKH